MSLYCQGEDAMSKPTQEPLDVLPDAQSSRRALLKGLLVGLGAGMLVQPRGGVTGLAFGQDAPKKEEKKKKKKGKQKESKKDY
jgi:hypothetical protein